MRLAMAQISSGSDKIENLSRAATMVKSAAAYGADVVIFPEFTMYHNKDLGPWFAEAAEPLNGPFCEGLASLAREHSVHVVAGLLEAIPGEPRFYNTVAVFDPSGDIVATYRKLHLYDAFGFRESDLVRPGEDFKPATFTVDGVRLGLMTCYDVRFPEIARRLAVAGVEVAVLPANWVPGHLKEEHWKVLATARAIENTYFVAAVCQGAPLSIGRSLLIDPMGVAVGEFPPDPAVGVYDVDPSRVTEVRKTNPSLLNRRFDVVERTQP